MKNWIDEIIADTVSNFNNRKIVIWGSHDTSKAIAKRLEEEHNINVDFFVDSDEAKQSREVYSPGILENMRGGYYLIIPLGRYKAIKDVLERWGYEKDKDYNYFCDCVIVENEEYYEDAHGNKIHGKRKNAKFVLTGYNSEIFIGDDVMISDECKFNMGSKSVLKIGNYSEVSMQTTIGNNTVVEIGNDCKLKIGKYVNVYHDVKLTIGNNSSLEVILFLAETNAEIKIGNNVLMYANCIRVLNNSVLSIGNNFLTTFIGSGFICSIPNYTGVYIGEDCMFSADITFNSSDAHTIFDVKTGKNINSTLEISQSRKIIIGNHVWIGMGASILYGAEIGSGSIIGAGSLVKGVIPNNCIAAGVPVRVIRKDVAWSRNNMSEDILDCGEKYINLTKD